MYNDLYFHTSMVIMDKHKHIQHLSRTWEILGDPKVPQNVCEVSLDTLNGTPIDYK